jgi:hypothetical protein
VRLLRRAGGVTKVLVLYGIRTGRWWLPLLVVLLPLVVLLAAATKAAVPTTMYVLF